MIQKTFLLSAAIGLLAVVAGCDTMRVGTGGMGDMGGFGRGGGADLGGLFQAGSRMLNAASLSEKDEDTIGQSVAVSLTSRYPLALSERTNDRDHLQRYVNLVGLTVANASAKADGHWIFGVIDTPEVNAFSGPNGYVFVTRGALARMQDEAELAGVLAHEVAHVCNHDGLTQVKNNETKEAALQGAQAADARFSQISGLADNCVDVLTRQGYDQKQEFAADQNGVKIMAAAGYNPRSYLAFLQRLQATGAAGGGQVMSTHPGIGERVAKVSAEINGMRPGGATLPQRFRDNAR